jgi:FtsZ-interacting cell division protein ZipA
MSDLQLGLLLIGAFAIVGVVAYNKRQEARYRRHAEASFRSGHEDVLMRGAANEGKRGEKARSRTAERIEPVLGARPAGDVERTPILSEAVDYLVAMQAADGVAGDAVLAAADTALAHCSKAIYWEGFSEAEGRWEALRPDRGYAMLRAGLQLVDRRGMVSPEELGVFAAGVGEVAAGLGAVAAVPEAASALARATELDRFCNDVDIRIALNLVSDAAAPFSGSKVRALAEAEHVLLDADGRFRRRDGSGQTLYELGNLEPHAFRADAIAGLSTRGLSAHLDVPRAPGGDATFADFTRFVQQLAQALGATIVDDNGRPLAPAAFQTIRSELRGVYESMEARGIAAGSRLALRLFS